MNDSKANSALGIGILALLLSLGSAAGVAYMLFIREDPLGKGIGKYDFSTPANTMKSQLQMESARDIKALLEYERKTRNRNSDEMLETLEVKKESEWGGKKILFVSFKRDGVVKYETQGFEKHANSGYWVRKYVSVSDVRADNKTLAESMENWERNGSLEPKPEPKK